MRKALELAILVGMSILFSLALLFMTIEVPWAINEQLMKIFPDWMSPPRPEKASEALEFLRPLGYIAFFATLILLIGGFVIKRTGLSTIGSIVSFLPTFGWFAISMFFLAGIGVLRVLWIPLFDLLQYVFPSYLQGADILRFGSIVFLPALLIQLAIGLIVWASGIFPFMDINNLLLYGPDISILLSYLVISFGLVIFVSGMFTWLYGKLKSYKIIDFWAYKRSRHPQYLGFLVWSYGLLLFSRSIGVPKGGYVPIPSLPWLISALVIIGVALNEESAMAEKYGEQYGEYRERTPFLFPTSKSLSTLITAPSKLLFKKSIPETRKEIACILLIYGILLVLLSTALISRFPEYFF